MVKQFNKSMQNTQEEQKENLQKLMQKKDELEQSIMGITEYLE